MRVLSQARRVLVLGVGICLASCHEVPEQSVEWVTGSVRSADGVLISYQMAGEGPVSVVFVHGWSCDRGYWKEQLDYFARVHRVVALDLAGHGDSGLNRDDWTFPEGIPRLSTAISPTAAV